MSVEQFSPKLNKWEQILAKKAGYNTDPKLDFE
jgi:hypothetical protein